MFSQSATLKLALLLLALCPASVWAKGVIVEQQGSLRSRSKVDAVSFQNDLQIAMGEVLGCGGQLAQDEKAEIERKLSPLWLVLPKNSKGRIERRSLRYLVHRYFNQKSALLIRGFEPSQPDDASWGSANILSQSVPAYVESVLESQHAREHGFSLHDAVQMVSMLKQLVFDSENTLLATVYQEQHKTTARALSQQGLLQVLESYMVHWMMGDDAQGIRLLLSNRTLLENSFPHWSTLVSFVSGQVRALDFQRQSAPAKVFANSQGHYNSFSQRFSFNDAHEVVGGITESFASFWESECASMKDSLIKMDTHHTGRVPLSKFYGSALDTEWRFGESESYLRELGALDETSPSRGKQVIIPNYIQAASNCIVSTPHYMVCCLNECEGRLREIEAVVSSPLASPSEIWALVGNMSSLSTLEDDEPLKLDRSLQAQLESIAATHTGKVPLHGRLFAQWLHYALPRECPFPHKAGTASIATPSQFGVDFLASDAEMKKHAHSVNASDELMAASMEKEELEWMSQWSPEEELISDYGGALHAPWERTGFTPNTVESVVGTMLFVLASLIGVVRLFGGKAGKHESMLLPTYGKSHFV